MYEDKRRKKTAWRLCLVLFVLVLLIITYIVTVQDLNEMKRGITNDIYEKIRYEEIQPSK